MLLLGACGNDEDDDKRERTGGGGGESDIAIMNTALELERTALAAYGLGAAEAAGTTGRLLRDLAAQEREHERALVEAIDGLGGTPRKERPREEYARGFPPFDSAAAVVRFGVDVENTAIAAYVEALPKLSSAGLRQMVVAILTNEAEHAALLRLELNQFPAAEAFETGKKEL